MSRAGAVLDGAASPSPPPPTTSPPRRWPSTAPTTWWCGGPRSGTSYDIYRGAGEPGRRRPRRHGHPHLHRRRTTSPPGGGLRRHQLPGGVGGHSLRNRLRHLRGAGEPGRRGARRRGHPHLHRRQRPVRARRWPSTAPTTWWCGGRSLRNRLRHLRGAGEPGRCGPRRTGIAISTAANDQCAPAVAFDGTNYLVVWEDGRSGTSSTSTGRG